MCAYANSLPQSFLFKASHFSSKRSPQSLLPKAFPQSSFLQSSLFKAPSSKPSPSKPFSQSASFKALSLLFFLFKALLQSLFLKASPQSLFFQSLLLKASPSKPSLSKLLLQSSLPQSFLFKASRFSSKRSPQSFLPKVYPQSSFLKAFSSKRSLQSPFPQSLSLKASSFSSKPFLSKLFFFKAFSFKAFCSKRFLQRVLKDIKGSRNQTSCCETLTRRNLSATKSAPYVHLGFPKIVSLTKIWGRRFGAKRF